jgi:flagellar motor switch/type III secretory pathway protein FliN
MGERRKRALLTRMTAAAERWADLWVSGSVSTVAVLEQSGVAREAARGNDIYGARRGDGEWLIRLEMPPRVAAWAAGARAGEVAWIGAPDPDSIAAALELKLIQALWQVLVLGAGTSHAPLERLDAAAASGSMPTLCGRGVSVTLRFEASTRFEMRCALSTALIADLLAERSPTSTLEPPVSRRAALSRVALKLDCHLGSLQVPVRDLHGLRPGDILLTDISLGSRAQLRVHGATPVVASGVIGEKDGRKAIKVETAYRGINQ